MYSRTSYARRVTWKVNENNMDVTITLTTSLPSTFAMKTFISQSVISLFQSGLHPLLSFFQGQHLDRTLKSNHGALHFLTGARPKRSTLHPLSVKKMADIERKKNVRVQSSWNKIFLRSNVALVEKHHIEAQWVWNFIDHESTTITKVCARIIILD